mmetsp:Transcript_11881/g.35429  ORF Transcript_11881/g.35429 Transcript_11881/m.35429 type:complete len:318 (-) Transcript_11881:390-1343(-)
MADRAHSASASATPAASALVTASVHVPSMYFVACNNVIGSNRLVRMRPTVVAAPAYRMASWPALCARLVASAAIDAVISTRIARSQISRFSSGAPPAHAWGHHHSSTSLLSSSSLIVVGDSGASSSASSVSSSSKPAPANLSASAAFRLRAASSSPSPSARDVKSTTSTASSARSESARRTMFEASPRTDGPLSGALALATAASSASAASRATVSSSPGVSASGGAAASSGASGARPRSARHRSSKVSSLFLTTLPRSRSSCDGRRVATNDSVRPVFAARRTLRARSRASTADKPSFCCSRRRSFRLRGASAGGSAP